MFSTLAPSVSKIRLTFAFWRANPNWMPRNPKLMFQICQYERVGFVVIVGLRRCERVAAGGSGRRPRGPGRSLRAAVAWDAASWVAPMRAYRGGSRLQLRATGPRARARPGG